MRIARVTYMLSLGGLQRLGRVVVELVPTESHPVFGPRCHLQKFNRQFHISPKCWLIYQALLNLDLGMIRLWLEKQKQTWLQNHDDTVWNVNIFTWQRLLCRLKTFRNTLRPKTIKTDISKKWVSGKKKGGEVNSLNITPGVQSSPLTTRPSILLRVYRYV